MRRVILTIGMLLMGMALVAGAAAALVPTSLLPLDQQVGTHTSAAGAVLGIGLMAAAVNPSANIGWVRAGILYGFVVLAFEAGSWLLWRAQFHLGPVIFGLAFSLLLIATYPEREKLLPAMMGSTTRKAATPAAPSTVKPPPALEPESEQKA
ncbi:MAG TPA: hypothetical protein VJP81_09525 [Candidatus Dormibacteraeota bacterium]|nr:hypothetical protein [Candidatus Dormibacteraeota bacterium]